MIIVTVDDCYRCDIFLKRNGSLVTDKWAKVIKVPAITGLGDKISSWLSKFGIYSCKECKLRQSFLNELFPNKDIEWEVRITHNRALKTGQRLYPILMTHDGALLDIKMFDSEFEEAVRQYEIETGMSVD